MNNVSPEIKALLRQFSFIRILIFFAASVLSVLALAIFQLSMVSLFIICALFICSSFLIKVHFSSYRNILKKECNPKKYAYFYNELSKKMKNQNEIRACYFEVATGLYYIGDAQWTLNYLGSHLPEKFIDIPDQPAYYNLIANCYYKLNNRQQMEEVKEKVKSILSSNPPKSVIQSINYSLVNIDFCLALFDNSLDKAKELLNRIYVPSVSSPKGMPPYQTVAMSYSYGLLALKQGDYTKAKEHFNFVVQNGNSLYYVTEAKQMLIDIANATQN
ncbi:MAG: hypothetical protein K5917_08310 [Clostridiales bacterium]|nr:hypothetical protein [Clostridiales bacterium]